MTPTEWAVEDGVAVLRDRRPSRTEIADQRLHVSERDLVLTPVHCRNRRCRELRRTGSPQLVGRLRGVAELKCPSCGKVDIYSS